MNASDQQKISEFLAPFSSDPYLKQYITDNLDRARQIVRSLANVHDGSTFDEWKENALVALRQTTHEASTEWQSLLLHFAHEELKAKAGNWFIKFWGRVFGWITRQGLGFFLQKYVDIVAKEILPIVQGAQTNDELKAALREAWAHVQQITQVNRGTWIQMAIDLAIIVLKKRGLLPAWFGSPTA